MFKVIIKETNEVNFLILTNADEVEYVKDFIGNTGALDDGQFVYDEEKNAYLVDQDNYEWWDEVIKLHQQVNDRIAELAKIHGKKAVQEAISHIDTVDLDLEAKAMLAALEDAFGAKKIEIKVENSGLYGEGINGTWQDALEEIGLKVPGWSYHEVDRHEWHGGKQHYWGTLLDDDQNVVYTFWAVVGEEEAEIEIEKE